MTEYRPISHSLLVGCTLLALLLPTAIGCVERLGTIATSEPIASSEEDAQPQATLAVPIAQVEPGDEATEGEQAEAEAPAELEVTQGVPLPGEEPEGEGVVRLVEDQPIWIDVNNNYVLVDGHVCLRQGILEMFACPAGTKEHEAIVAVDTRAQNVHAGLLAVRAEPGNPVQFRPVYKAASGTEVDVYVLWADEEGNRHSVPAQAWIRKLSDGTQMETPWVFAGSVLVENPETGLRDYGADMGDLICVSNFPTAMLDLPIESTDLDENRLFEAFTENIPARLTPVRLVLVPQLEAPAEGEAEGEEE